MLWNLYHRKGSKAAVWFDGRVGHSTSGPNFEAVLAQLARCFKLTDCMFIRSDWILVEIPGQEREGKSRHHALPR